MTNHETSPDQPPRFPADPALAGCHRGLVLASAILATGGMLVAGGYGLWNDLLVLWAPAIDSALAALAAWLCLNVCRLRRQAVLAEQHPEVDAQATRIRTSGCPRPIRSSKPKCCGNAITRIGHACGL